MDYQHLIVTREDATLWVTLNRPERLNALNAGIVARDALEDEARAYLKDMLHATPLGLRLTKEALNHAIDAQSLEAAIAMEDRNQILCAQGEHFREGVSAFLEKREPDYR